MNPNKALWEEGDFARIAQSMRAAADGRATELQAELEALFNSQNTSPSEDATSIPATFLRVTVTP